MATCVSSQACHLPPIKLNSDYLDHAPGMGSWGHVRNPMPANLMDTYSGPDPFDHASSMASTGFSPGSRTEESATVGGVRVFAPHTSPGPAPGPAPATKEPDPAPRFSFMRRALARWGLGGKRGSSRPKRSSASGPQSAAEASVPAAARPYTPSCPTSPLSHSSPKLFAPSRVACMPAAGAQHTAPGSPRTHAHNPHAHAQGMNLTTSPTTSFTRVSNVSLGVTQRTPSNQSGMGVQSAGGGDGCGASGGGVGPMRPTHRSNTQASVMSRQGSAGLSSSPPCRALSGGSWQDEGVGPRRPPPVKIPIPSVPVPGSTMPTSIEARNTYGSSPPSPHAMDALVFDGIEVMVSGETPTWQPSEIDEDDFTRRLLSPRPTGSHHSTPPRRRLTGVAVTAVLSPTAVARAAASGAVAAGMRSRPSSWNDLPSPNSPRGVGGVYPVLSPRPRSSLRPSLSARSRPGSGSDASMGGMGGQEATGGSGSFVHAGAAAARPANARRPPPTATSSTHW